MKKHSRAKLNKTQRQEYLTAFVFLLPTFLVFIVFKYYPLIENFRLSLTNWNLFTEPKFIGLNNYKTIFKTPLFYTVLKNTFFFTIFSTLFSMVIGFLVAVALQKKKGTFPSVLKTIFFIPNITTASAVAILWIWIFDPDFGLFGQIYSALGLTSPRWLLTPGYAMWIIISLAVWRSVGYQMLIFSSGLSSISDEVYESARIDGATPIQQVWYITLPLLKPTTVFLLVTNFIQAMQVFDIVSVMTGGGPYNTTNVLNLYIYQSAFGRNKAGYAAALSVILFMILLVCTIIQQIISKKQEA